MPASGESICMDTHRPVILPEREFRLSRRRLLVSALAAAGIARGSLAAPEPKKRTWIGPSGGHVWHLTGDDLSVFTFGGRAPRYSARSVVRTGFQPEGFTAYEVHARPLSLVGS